MNRFGEMIKKKLTEQGLTQAQLADIINCSESALNGTLNHKNISLNKMDEIAEALDCTLEFHLKPKNSPFVEVPFFECKVSAGMGYDLFDGSAFKIKVEATPEAKQADFAVQVDGNSMLPTFEYGDMVLIQKQDTIDIGQIGVFIVNGQSYIKELGKNELISHNPNTEKYPNIPLKRSDYVKCVGLVLGIATPIKK